MNANGYLIDSDNNIVDLHGRIVFKKEILEKTSKDNPEALDIPRVFKMNVFRSS